MGWVADHVDEVRQSMAGHPDWLREIADRVAARTCQCCPGDDDELMACGHYRCELCRARDHDCLACVLAV